MLSSDASPLSAHRWFQHLTAPFKRCRYAVANGSKPSPLDLSIFEQMHRISAVTDFVTKVLTEPHGAVSPKPWAVIIYSDEELRDDAELEVPLQIKYMSTYPSPVMSSSQASVSCAALGTSGLLKELNRVLCTYYSEDVPGLVPALRRCIALHYDFGTALGLLRRYWFEDVAEVLERFEEDEDEDTQMRNAALDRDRMVVTNPNIPPRRVWDLYSNHVVPFSVCAHGSRPGEFGGQFGLITPLWVISHSWVEARERHDVDTPINGHEWRVPLPTDTTLDRIRVEMLNLGAEYVWLDVLCLRQQDGSKPEKETLREEEWLLDVPTIGSIYQGNLYIVTYFEGLGRPFRLSDTRADRNWTNRTWTLQEASRFTYIGGMTPTSLWPPRAESLLDDNAKRFYAALAAMTQDTANGLFDSTDLFKMVGLVLARKSSFNMDKIAGLAYKLRAKVVPAYFRGGDTQRELEAAWWHLTNTMDDACQFQLIFMYPAPGDPDAGCAWRPTWRQLASGETLIPHAYLKNPLSLDFSTIDMQEDDSVRSKAFVLDHCTIRYLGKPDRRGHCRYGTLEIAGDAGGSTGPGGESGRASLRVVAHHQHPIADDQSYVLVGFMVSPILSNQLMSEHWLVGTYVDDGMPLGLDEGVPRIRKVSVVELDGDDAHLRARYRGLVEAGLLTRERELVLV